jgi:hypothetical protein
MSMPHRLAQEANLRISFSVNIYYPRTLSIGLSPPLLRLQSAHKLNQAPSSMTVQLEWMKAVK